MKNLGLVKLFEVLNNFENIQKAEIKKHSKTWNSFNSYHNKSTDGDVVTKKTKLLGEELQALKIFFPPVSLRHMLWHCDVSITPVNGSLLQLLAPCQCCQPCGSLANLSMFFLTLQIILKTCVLLLFGLVLFFSCLLFAGFCFCELLVFEILCIIYCFNLLQNATWACFCVNLLGLGLFIQICRLFLFLNYLFFVLFNFPMKSILVIFFDEIADFRLVFVK